MAFGGVLATKSGTPTRLADPFYWIMEMGWLAFACLVSSTFLLINLLFGLAYLAIPGAIANAEPGSLSDATFFSIDTLATVGYGNMYPGNRAGHALASLEILVGLFFSATVTGLIFARFSRPRQSFIFSKVAVISEFDGKRSLMIRVASLRSHPLIDVAAQLSWLETTQHPNGKVFRKLTELPLLKSRNPILGLAWTLVHPLEEDSPMLRALESSERFLLTATVSGLDTLLASTSQGNFRYERSAIQIDREFVDAISEHEGSMHLDLVLLHETKSIDATEGEGKRLTP